MVDVTALFEHKSVDINKLIQTGFVYKGSLYEKGIPILDHAFILQVIIEEERLPRFKVIEIESKEEYVLVHVQAAQGEFVNAVREACQIELENIANTCYQVDMEKVEQVKRAIQYIQESFGVSPEYLWEKDPDSAAFRIGTNAKWFGVMMRIEARKLGLEGYGRKEILVLKEKPEQVQLLLQTGPYLPAYHMNKKHWYTICLDGSIKDEELFARIAASYAMVK